MTSVRHTGRMTERRSLLPSLIILVIAAALAAAAAFGVFAFSAMTCLGEASDPLRTDYVKGGKVGVEVRNAVRDKYDLAAALLATAALALPVAPATANPLDIRGYPQL